MPPSTFYYSSKTYVDRMLFWPFLFLAISIDLTSLLSFLVASKLFLG